MIRLAVNPRPNVPRDNRRIRCQALVRRPHDNILLMHSLIDDNREAIRALCRQYGVRRLEVFGSLLRADFDAEASDVDILVVFEPGEGKSFAKFLDLKEALEALFGRPVDLLEPHTIRNRRLRHHIEKSSVPVYAAA